MSTPSPPLMTSVPPPPNSASSPVPPVSVSFPAPPISVSLPAKPEISSLPARPSIVSSASVPSSTSSPAVGPVASGSTSTKGGTASSSSSPPLTRATPMPATATAPNPNRVKLGPLPAERPSIKLCSIRNCPFSSTNSPAGTTSPCPFINLISKDPSGCKIASEKPSMLDGSTKLLREACALASSDITNAPTAAAAAI